MLTSQLESILLREGVSAEAVEAYRRTAVAADLEAADRPRLIRALAAEIDPEPRRLALELSAELPMPIEPALIPWLRPLLRDRRLGRLTLARAANVLLRSAHEATRTRVLRDFAAGFGRVGLLRHWRRLRREFGNSPEFDLFCSRLRRTVPLRCPRCRVKRPPAAMVRHLWRAHRRLLDGRHVRSAWNWLDQRLSQLPRGADPTDALVSLQRYLRRWNLKDKDDSSIRMAVNRRGACLCPFCASSVAQPKIEVVPPLTVSHGRIAGNGIAVQVAVGPSRPHVRIRRLVLPFVVLALLLAATLSPAVALLGATGSLAIAFALRLIVGGRSPANLTDLTIDRAWEDLGSNDSPTIARLATASIGQGNPNLRETLIEAALQRTSDPAERTALIALQVADSARLGRDPVAVLANGIAGPFTGENSLSQAEILLAEVPWRSWPANRISRLRIILLARAFSAGLGPWELHELGKAVPPLGQLLQADDIDSLARLRLLWTLQPDRPWQHCGTAATVFEMANYAITGEEHLAAVPDLLLFVARPGAGKHGSPSPVLLCARGMLFSGAMLTAPAPITVSPRPAGQGYDLVVGPHQFRYRRDPAAVAAALRDWSEYLFRDFLPHTQAALGQPDGARLKRLLRSKTLACPNCGGLFRS